MESFKYSASSIAEEYNLWIRHLGHWYTPDQFKYHINESVLVYNRRRVIFRDPLQVLTEGNQIIANMIRRREDPEKIVEALRRRNKFESDIRRYYKETGWTLKKQNAHIVIEEYYKEGDEFVKAAGPHLRGGTSTTPFRPLE